RGPARRPRVAAVVLARPRGPAEPDPPGARAHDRTGVRHSRRAVGTLLGAHRAIDARHHVLLRARGVEARRAPGGLVCAAPGRRHRRPVLRGARGGRAGARAPRAGADRELTALRGLLVDFGGVLTTSMG